MRRIYGLIALAFIGGNALGLSQEQSPSTLDSLIVVALRNNPEVEMVRFESLAAEQRIGPAASLPDPQLKIAAMNVPTNLKLSSEMMTMVPQVSLMQMIPWFGKLGAAADVQRSLYESTTERLTSVRLDVVTNLKRVYGETYRVEQTLGYLRYKKRLLQSVVKVSEQLFSVGQVPQQDIFRATAELTTVRSDILMEQSMLVDLQAQLGALLGQNDPLSIRVDTLQFTSLDSLGLLQDRVKSDNPELKQIQSMESAANAKALFAKKDAVPDLSLGISYGYRGALMPDGTKALDMMSIEVGVSLPIFFGSKQRAMIDEADMMKMAAERQLNSVEIALTSKLRSSFAAAQAQRDLIPLYSKELIPQYEATYNSSLSAYAVGKTTFAMVIDNLTALVNAKIELVKIQSSYFSTVADISRLVGEGSGISGGVQ
jgi:outer membrane protein, heavy metal efflux system